MNEGAGRMAQRPDAPGSVRTVLDSGGIMIRKAMILAASIMGAATLPLAAHAQVTTQTIARCVVDSDERHVARLLGTAPGSAAEQGAKHALAETYRNCMDGRGVAKLEWRDRAELALAAAQSRYAGVDGFNAPGRIDWVAAASGTSVDPQAAALRAFGDCIVKSAPDASVGLIRSESGSAAEKAALTQLAPAISPCVTADQTMKITLSQLRLLVAEPLYHGVGR